MSTRTKEEIQEIWAATNAPHTKSNKPPRLTKKEKKLIGVGKDEGRAELKYARISSRKVKIVADLIKGKSAIEATVKLKSGWQVCHPDFILLVFDFARLFLFLFHVED